MFWINDNPWVTRCTQEDAVMLSDTSKRIDISGPNKEISVHDGIVRGNRVYFTTVDAHIVIADTQTFEVLETINISAIEGLKTIRGWCRGLYIQDDIFYIGFSRLRKTKQSNKISWIKNLATGRTLVEECSVLAFDITKRKIINSYSIPDAMIDAIYSILPEPG